MGVRILFFFSVLCYSSLKQSILLYRLIDIDGKTRVPSTKIFEEMNLKSSAINLNFIQTFKSSLKESAAPSTHCVLTSIMASSFSMTISVILSDLLTSLSMFSH